VLRSCLRRPPKALRLEFDLPPSSCKSRGLTVSLNSFKIGTRALVPIRGKLSRFVQRLDRLHHTLAAAAAFWTRAWLMYRVTILIYPSLDRLSTATDASVPFVVKTEEDVEGVD
jgi:hypothetical protein